ncbi:hypothetical protein ACFVYE_36485 [Streptomyces sp. NPDC058239]|uniref:hypothetical protein n=1 Tax=unclassified Streptomyces TaxID=2593676 RepID=UPI0036607DBE
MTEARIVQTAFARLVREHAHLTDVDRRIMRAFEELMDGRPQITDGSLTVVNIAAEAGVGRASYYRSPVAAAIKEILSAPEARRPEVDELKAEITRLRKAERDLRKEKAAELRELQDTVATYANQIQALTLRNAELEEDAPQTPISGRRGDPWSGAPAWVDKRTRPPFASGGRRLDDHSKGCLRRVGVGGQASGSTSGCVNRTGLPSDRA